MSVTILIPVLQRPHRVEPLVESIAASLEGETEDVRTLFLVSPGCDGQTIMELQRLDQHYYIVSWEPGPADYARKINCGAHTTDTDWLFTAADDLHFHPGWLTACLLVHARTGALVIGTNDMHNPSVISGRYATHLLVHRDFLDRCVVDEPGNLFCQKYDHNCVDTELCETAQAQRMYAPARDAHVEHLHPVFRNAPDDAVYRKGRANHMRDKSLLNQRRRLWRRYLPPTRNVMPRQVAARPAPVARWPKR